MRLKWPFYGAALVLIVFVRGEVHAVHCCEEKAAGPVEMGENLDPCEDCPEQVWNWPQHFFCTDIDTSPLTCSSRGTQSTIVLVYDNHCVEGELFDRCVQLPDPLNLTQWTDACVSSGQGDCHH